MEISYGQGSGFRVRCLCTVFQNKPRTVTTVIKTSLVHIALLG